MTGLELRQHLEAAYTEEEVHFFIDGRELSLEVIELVRGITIMPSQGAVRRQVQFIFGWIDES